MQSTSNGLSEKVRAQSVELSDLADAIDLYARLQQARLIAGGRHDFRVTHELFDRAPAPVEDYSDLLPNPPADPTSWRGAQFRRLRNAAEPGSNNTPASAAGGHGRGVPE